MRRGYGGYGIQRELPNPKTEIRNWLMIPRLPRKPMIDARKPVELEPLEPLEPELSPGFGPGSSPGSSPGSTVAVASTVLRAGADSAAVTDRFADWTATVTVPVVDDAVCASALAGVNAAIRVDIAGLVDRKDVKAAEVRVRLVDVGAGEGHALGQDEVQLEARSTSKLANREIWHRDVHEVDCEGGAEVFADLDVLGGRDVDGNVVGGKHLRADQ